MQAYPHHYLATATGRNQGNVIVSGEGLPDLDTASPPQFGGPEGVWSPETMLSATVANCFILSFRAIARASKFEWTSLECKVDGVLERPERALPILLNSIFMLFYTCQPMPKSGWPSDCWKKQNKFALSRLRSNPKSS